MPAASSYSVLIDMADHNWGFLLRPTVADGRRTWRFRAVSEDQRAEWAQRLVAATYVNSKW